MTNHGSTSATGRDPTLDAVLAEQVTGRGAVGVVAAAAPLAAAAGAEALRAGGNAYDAVVAAALAETVLLPSKCGLGGDLIAIAHHHARTTGDAASEATTLAAPAALLAIGGAPAGLADVAARGELADTGPFAVGPPAAPAGYLALAARGRLPLAATAQRAITLARHGFAWAAVNERLTHASLKLLHRWNPDGTVFLPDGAPIPAGAIVTLPGHARALDELVAAAPDGDAAFLAGPFGTAVVATVAARGGVLRAADFAAARAEWTPCASGAAASAGGALQLWATPAPTHGPSLLHAMATAVPGDPALAQYRRALDAIAARRQTLGDPATPDPSGTSMVSAADADGNVVVVVHSNSYPRYGSGLIVDGYDVVLANRAGRGFSSEPGHPNFPRAGRRPATTLHAWMAATADGTRRWLGGTPGGDNQMTWNAQLLQHLVDDLDAPVGTMVTSPRWEWLPADDGVRVEAGFADADIDALAAAVPRLTHAGRLGMACAQQVVTVLADGRCVVAADPRTVGLALGV